MSEFGVSDSPCNTSTMNECGVNLHYVKVGLSRRVRGPSVVPTVPVGVSSQIRIERETY